MLTTKEQVNENSQACDRRRIDARKLADEEFRRRLALRSFFHQTQDARQSAVFEYSANPNARHTSGNYHAGQYFPTGGNGTGQTFSRQGRGIEIGSISTQNSVKRHALLRAEPSQDARRG